MREQVTWPGIERIGERFLGRAGQFIFGEFEGVEEVRNRFGAEEEVGRGRFADQFLHSGCRAVEGGAERQTFMFGEDLVEFGGVPGRRVSAEDVEGDRAEREYVRHWIAPARIEDRFGREIDEAGFFRELAGVQRVGSRCRGTGAGTGCEDAARLPIEEPDLRVVGIRMNNEDAFRAEGAVNDPMAVGVADSIGDLAHEVEASCEGEGRAALAQVVIQANLVGFTTEQDCGTEVVLIEFAGAQDSGVFERFQNVEFLESGPADGFVRGFVFACDIVDADSAGGFRSGMFGLEVLVREERVLFDQFLQDVVADGPLSL